jgi:tetratricopeptide (TPR) repeat protein
MTHRQQKFEAQIEALVAPHAERVRDGGWVTLGRLRDLYPSRADETQPPTGDNYVWLIALNDVVSRHSITIGNGFVFVAADGSPPSDAPAETQLLLVPRGTHGPSEPDHRDPAERHHDRGLHFWSNNCAEEALEELGEAIRLKLEWADAYYSLGEVLCSVGQLEAGIAAYREAIRLDPGDADKYHPLGWKMQFEAGRAAEAIELYREGIRAVPDASWLHHSLALALDDLGENEEAIAEYREAIRLDPSVQGYHYNLAHLLTDAGRLDEATAECQEALRLSPNDECAAELMRQITRART